MMKYLIALLLIFVSAAPLVADAATVSIVGAPDAVRPGDSFLVDVMLDTEGKEMNATAGVLAFSSAYFSARAVYERDTIVGAWIVRPRIDDQGTIAWSGIVPGGFNGVLGPYHQGALPGRLFTVQFEAVRDGKGMFSLTDLAVLLNDGAGTRDVVRATTATVAVHADAPVRAEPRLTDRIPPEVFIPLIARSEGVAEGKWFVAFTAHDKETGVSHYAVFESRRIRDVIGQQEWERVESPYVLRDQSRQSYVYVRAVDGAGNERVVALAPIRRAYDIADMLIGFVILIVLACAPFVVGRIRSRRPA